ncbi:hypothetical protein GWD52_20925 [Enterobacteriaceae bacterium 4M9]|nr:hypothetical protein [Enterobacteriaceae bacterium 4M9]
MFKSIADAKTFLFNHGNLDLIELDKEDEIVERLYREADTKEAADTIVSEYII